MKDCDHGSYGDQTCPFCCNANIRKRNEDYLGRLSGAGNQNPWYTDDLGYGYKYNPSPATKAEVDGLRRNVDALRSEVLELRGFIKKLLDLFLPDGQATKP